MRAAGPRGIDPDEEIDLGLPGASARAESERRRQRDERRRQEVFGRYLAPVVKVIAGERPSTATWDRGGRGEERVGSYLRQTVGDSGLVLHDRAIPGSRSNIDHIAVVPSGVWVIDTKAYKGRVRQRDVGGWFVSRPALFVNGRNHTKLIPAVQRQSALVRRAIRADVPMHAVLCFADAEWGLLGRPFTIDGVVITWAERLAGSLGGAGPLSNDSIRALAVQIAAVFPRYEDPGTSHRPTGAWPKG